MSLIEYSRGLAFWFFDLVKGRKVKKAFELLEEIEGKNISDDEAEKIQKVYLDQLLHHCISNVEAYKGQTSTCLQEWPVVNKLILKDNSYHLATNMTSGRLFEMATSGSTGTPFIIKQDVVKKRHVNAEVIFYNKPYGYSIGKSIVYFRSVVRSIKKSKLQELMQNIHYLDCSDLSDEGISNMLINLKHFSKSGSVILSYASTLETLRRYCDKKNITSLADCNIKGVVSQSEILYDATRAGIGSLFDCKCVSRYSNEENGILAQDDYAPQKFLYNRANYIIEILKMDCDEPAGVGELGRIVVTDLFNYAMPMVRYDTGDIAKWEKVEIDGKIRKAITGLSGRKVDMIYDTDGNMVSPHAITNTLWNFPEILQFQFIQKGANIYVMKVTTKDNRLERENDLICQLKSYLGDNARIDINYCDDIPILASGKRRYIVNEFSR